MSEDIEKGIITHWVVKNEALAKKPETEGGTLGWRMYVGQTEDGRYVYGRPLSGPHARREDAERVLAEFQDTELYRGAYLVQKADAPEPIVEPHTKLPRERAA